ncbi:hypothetical protein QUB80_14645 [Chlorogloeopsis sp. ULAP01]|uniref:hypothetical protein n=1 Tax=Chlorogloeopsis sp. ULAP01 TaxID=3056483 RepID=UPI0025AA4FC7|nr:hypothetical protein [Chlorogloeopsis sp. ULAP01]MDM9381941.1 hypothetical protein [Chlorogloeopsis sp. ULAP01]
MQLFSSHTWRDCNFNTLLAGTTQAPSFQKERLGNLDNVAVELTEISKQVPQSKKLENLWIKDNRPLIKVRIVLINTRFQFF